MSCLLLALIICQTCPNTWIILSYSSTTELHNLNSSSYLPLSVFGYFSIHFQLPFTETRPGELHLLPTQHPNKNPTQLLSELKTRETKSPVGDSSKVTRYLLRYFYTILESYNIWEHREETIRKMSRYRQAFHDVNFLRKVNCWRDGLSANIGNLSTN